MLAAILFVDPASFRLRNSSNVRLPLGRLSFLLVLLLSGCNSRQAQTPATPVSTRSSISTPSGLMQAQSSPLFAQARAACKTRDYRKAADLLQTLERTPGLSPEAVAYTHAQRDICLRDAGLLPATVPATAPVTTSQPVRTVADADCGPRALLLVCQELGVKADLATLRQKADTSAQGTSFAGLQKSAQSLGLSAKGVQVSRDALSDLSLPALAWVDRNHYVALLHLDGSGDRATATIHDPNQPAEETLPQEKLLQRCGGFLLLVHR